MTATLTLESEATPLSPKQLRSISEATGRVNIWEGSIRSGKTIGSLLRWLIYIALDCPAGGELVVISRTRESAARNVFGPLQDPTIFGDAAQHVHYTAGAPTAKILGRTVHVLGASDVKSEKVLRGMTCGGAYVDEITVIPEDFFTQLLGRMSIFGAKLFGTTNPDSPSHWFKKRFLDRLSQLTDWRRWHFVLSDNPSLSTEYVESISREYTGLWHKRFILGEWVVAEGAVYPMWDEQRHKVAWQDLPVMERLFAVGIDYGTTNATAALLLGMNRRVNGTPPTPRRLYLIDEWRHDPAIEINRLTDAEISTQLRAWLRQPHLPKPADPRIVQPPLEPEWIIADPSAASLRTQLYKDGINTQPADNDVSYGIRTMASLLGGDQLRVSDRCTGFLDEVTGYSWDAKATEKGHDAPIKTADHSLDAGRYAVITTEAEWRDLLDAPIAA